MRPEMSCTSGDEDNWRQYQEDQEREQQEVADAFEHLNLVISAIEREFSMSVDTTREKIRFLEAAFNRK